MINKLASTLLVLFLVASCGIETRTDTLTESERNTVTKITEVQEHIADDGSIYLLSKEVYKEEVSKDTATAEQKKVTTVKGPNVTKAALGLLGIPPAVIDMLLGALGMFGAAKGAGAGKKVYDNIRDAKPRDKKQSTGESNGT